MKKILCLIGLLSLVGCNDVRKDTVAKKAVELRTKNVSALTTLNDYETHPDTFALFFYPEEKELTWSSPLFNDSDLYQTKVKNIVDNLLTLSKKRDELDKEIFILGNSASNIDIQMETENCLIDPTTDVCMELDSKLSDLNTQIVTKTNESSAHLKGIQESLDKDINNPVNWQEYGGDAKAYEFDINEVTGEVSILMPKLGAYDNRYSTKGENPDIVNVLYYSSQYDPDVKLLSFALLEKGQNGERTGYVYDFKLEKMSYLNKIRFKGTVIKKFDGDEVTRGVCKFELPLATK